MEKSPNVDLLTVELSYSYLNYKVLGQKSNNAVLYVALKTPCFVIFTKMFTNF